MKGSITISRYTNTEIVSIRFDDDMSGTQFLTVEMTMKDFANALMGSGNIDCDFELFPERVGKKHEWKKEVVFMPDGAYSDGEARAKLACEPYEVDGWVADYKNCLNHHCVVRGTTTKEGAKYEVIFHRWVDVP